MALWKIILSIVEIFQYIFSHLNILRIHPPHLEAVIHPTGYYPGTVQVKVGAKHLVPVSLYSPEYCDVVFSLREAAD